MMISKTRRFAAIVAAAAAITAVTPGPASGAIICSAVSQSTGSEVAIVLEGHYAWTRDGAADVFLTCHLFQKGVEVAAVTDPLVGPVATLVSDQRLSTDPYTVCYSVTVNASPRVPPARPVLLHWFSNC